MNQTEQKPISEIKLNTDNLFREETFTDLEIGTIKRYVPVNPDGSQDHGRKLVFKGQTTLVSNSGPLPISCKIEAKNLKEAIEKFPDAVNKSVEELIEEAKKLQEKESSQIIVPNSSPAGNILTK